MRVAPLALFHLSALAIMLWSEIHLLAMAVFALTWGLVNFLWLVLLRRPALAAALSLVLFVVLIMVSRFKYDVLWMSLSFIDVMIIDADTFAFLMDDVSERAHGRDRRGARGSFRSRSCSGGSTRSAFAVALPPSASSRVLPALPVSQSRYPVSPGEAFGDENYVSHFVRTGVDAVAAYVEQGFLESDSPMTVAELRAEAPCEPTGKRPHIILVHDESSFDIRAIDGVKVPPGYGHHFLLVRRQGAQVPGRGRRRTELVHRIQRAFWPLIALLRPLPVLRDAHRGRPGRARPAARAAALRLPHPRDLSGERRLSGRAAPTTRASASQHFVDGKDIGGDVFEPDRFYFDAACA